MTIADCRFQIVDFRMQIGINGTWKFEDRERWFPDRRLSRICNRELLVSISFR